MSHGVLLQSSTPSSFTVAPSGSVLTRSLTMIGAAGRAVSALAVGVGTSVGVAVAAAARTPGAGRTATYPTTPAIATAPTSAVRSIPLDPLLAGASGRDVPAAGESLGIASGDGMLPGSLGLPEREAASGPLPVTLWAACGPLPSCAPGP